MTYRCVRCGVTVVPGPCPECAGACVRVLDERDEARATVATYEEQIAPALAAVTRERDEARAEVERLRAGLRALLADMSQRMDDPGTVAASIGIRALLGGDE